METQLHIERIIRGLPIYHVGVTYKLGPLKKRFDFHPKRMQFGIQGTRKTINLGKSKRNALEILNFEKTIHDKNYFLLVNDCRHYTKRLLEFSLDDPLDVINLFTLHNLFSNL